MKLCKEANSKTTADRHLQTGCINRASMTEEESGYVGLQGQIDEDKVNRYQSIKETEYSGYMIPKNEYQEIPEYAVSHQSN